MFGKKDDVQVSHLGFHMQGSFVHSLCLSLTTLLPISDREESYKASREMSVKKLVSTDALFRILGILLSLHVSYLHLLA